MAVKRISAAHISEIDTSLYESSLAHSTKDQNARALRRTLRWLWEYHGCKKLDAEVRQYWRPAPRNVTATRGEIDSLLAAAPAYLRLWLLLCSDLAIRSGTAARIGPGSYDGERREIRFTTKYEAKVTLPVTDAIAELLARCDHAGGHSFVRQLWLNTTGRKTVTNHSGKRKPWKDNYALAPTCLGREFRALLKSQGITRNLRPHDLRRTAAVKMYEATRDLRDVQALLGHSRLASTIWYLDHDLRPVSRATLELIKGGKAQPQPERKQA